MSAMLSLQDLKNAVANATAFRCRRRLQPAGGAGTKIFPPTYPGGVYATEPRRLPGIPNPVECVLLDSVQSQANRMEEALQQAADGGTIAIPVVAVDFSDAALLEPVGRITSLEAPHRISDAILRDAMTADGKKFRESEIGATLNHASTRNAGPLFDLCPTSLIFGIWDSTGPKGGLGMKVERAMASEIVAINVAKAEKARGVRHDPLGIRAAIALTGTASDWRVAEGQKAKSTIKPSEINHGNVPFDGNNAGVTFDFAEQTTVLSLVALRRLRFPINGKPNPSADMAGHATLAALAMFAAAAAAEKGLDLRSRCVLWPEGPMEWELLERPGDQPQSFTITASHAAKLLKEAYEICTNHGLRWREEPLILKPTPQLVELVKKSQEIAAANPGVEE